jgi:hypothetical protein
MIVIIVASSSLTDESKSKSKFNDGGVRSLSHMKAWHMVFLELDKTLTMF